MARRPKRPAPTAAASKAIAATGRKLSQARAQAKKAQTKDLRHAVSLLKKSGVIRRKVDARSVRNTRYRREQVRSFEGVLTGRIAAVKAKPSIVRDFRNAGAKIANGRILVAKEPEQIAMVRKGELTEGVVVLRARLTRDLVEEQIIIPIPPQSVGDLIRDLRDHPKKYDRLKSPEDRFGFKINGHNSIATFSNAGLMAEWLEAYDEAEGFDELDRDDDPDFLTVFRVSPGATGYHAGIKNKYRGERSRERDNFRHRAKRNDPHYRAANAARMRQVRARDKGTK